MHSLESHSLILRRAVQGVVSRKEERDTPSALDTYKGLSTNAAHDIGGEVSGI